MVNRPNPFRSIAVTAAVLVIVGLIAWGAVGRGSAGTTDPGIRDPAAAQTSLPGLVAPSGAPELAGITRLHPRAGEVLQASGPFDDRFTLDALAFDGRTVRGTVRVISDVSTLLELEVLAGFYDSKGTLLATDRFVHHLVEDGGSPAGHPSESVIFSIAVPAGFADRVASVGVGVPVLVNE